MGIHESGLAVLNVTAATFANLQVGCPMYHLTKRHAIFSFTHNGGFYEAVNYETIQSGHRFQSIVHYINGVANSWGGGLANQRRESFGYFADPEGNVWTVQVNNNAGAMAAYVIYRGLLTEFQPQPCVHRDFTITLEQQNILNNFEEIIQEIINRAININIDGGDENVVINVPIITPETLPNVSIEEFNEIWLAINQSFNLIDFIMTREEAASISSTTILPRITIINETTIIENPPQGNQLPPIEQREAFWTRLLNFFISIFVPRTNYFQIEIDILEDRLHRRLPFQTFIEAIARLQAVSGAMDGDATVFDVDFNYGGERIRVDMGSRMLPHLQQARTLITGLYVILLAYYNYRQIYFLIRGTNYQSMSGGVK
jgi:hypothetical protein